MAFKQLKQNKAAMEATMNSGNVNSFFDALEKFKNAKSRFSANEISRPELIEAARVLVSNEGGFYRLSGVQKSSNSMSNVAKSLTWAYRLIAVGGLAAAIFMKENVLKVLGALIFVGGVVCNIFASLVEKHGKGAADIYVQMKDLLADAKTILNEKTF